MQRKMDLISLPVELLFSIIFYLLPEEIMRLAFISKHYNEIFITDAIWIDKVKKHFPQQKSVESNALADFKKNYLTTYKYISNINRKIFSMVMEGHVSLLEKMLTMVHLTSSRDLLESVLRTKNQELFDVVYKKFLEQKKQEFVINLFKASDCSLMHENLGNHQCSGKHECSVRYEDVPLLHLSVLLNQKPAIVQALSMSDHAKRDIFYYGRPLIIAANFNYHQLIPLLLPNKMKYAVIALKNAVKSGSDEVVKLLYQHITSFQSSIATQEFLNEMLFTAAEGGHPTIIKFFYEKKAKVNVLYKYNSSAQDNESKMTPLHVAVALERIEAVKILLEYKADANIASFINDDNLYPLVDAANISLEMIQLLIASGANINVTNSDGESALHAAIMKDNIEIVSFLLNNGVKTDALFYEKKPSELVKSEPMKNLLLCYQRQKNFFEKNRLSNFRNLTLLNNNKDKDIQQISNEPSQPRLKRG